MLRRELERVQDDLVALEAGGDGPAGIMPPEHPAERAATERQRTATRVIEAETPNDEDFGDLLDTLLGGDDYRHRQAKSRVKMRLRQFMPVVLIATIVFASSYILSLVLVERPEDGYSTLWDGWVFHIAVALPAMLAALRALTDRRGRWAWSAISVGIALNAAGNLLFTYRDQNIDPVPFPAWSDIPYLESSLALAVGFVLVTQLETPGASKASRLNGLVIGLAAAAVAVALWFDGFLEQSGSTAAVLVGLAYPLSDLVIIVIVLSGLSPARYRPSSAAATLLVGAALWVFADIVYLGQIASDTYQPATMLEAVWVIGIVLFGVAPWLPQHRWHAHNYAGSVGHAIVPWIAAFGALAVIGLSVGNEIPDLAVWLAMAAIAAVMLRIALTIGELRNANAAFSQAWVREVGGVEEPIPAPVQPVAATTGAPSAGAFWLVTLGAIATTALVGVGVLLWQVASDGNRSDAPQTEAAIEPSSPDIESSEAPAAAAATPFPATGSTVVGAESEGRHVALKRDLDRLLSFTPLVFNEGQTELSANHERVLNSVAALLLSSPGIPVTVVGYTDDVGSTESNTQLSTERATAVYNYLVAQGVAESDLIVEGRGEAIASGTSDLAGFERRIEFEVGAAPDTAAGPGNLRVGVVAISAQNDLAFTQSMVDSLNALAANRGGIEVTIIDNAVVRSDAEVAVRDMASQGFDLVVVHDPQLGSMLSNVATEFPDVTFAWGPTTQAPTLANVYTYSASAEEGGYVFGSIAAGLSQSETIGFVGPIEAGDAQRYASGFEAGATEVKPTITVDITYIGSFLDTSAAAETALTQISGGADVLTGSGPMTTSAATVATQGNIPWFANQSDQSSVAPDLVVASQVYHWDVVLGAIIADRDEGQGVGRAIEANLANGGLTIDFNPSYPLDPALRQQGDIIIAGIVDGSITPPAE